MADEDRSPGKFVITGSQQFGLLAGVTQSLAGRVGITQLLPLSLGELTAKNLKRLSIDRLMITGCYPALHTSKVKPEDWFAGYVATYIERDVRKVMHVQDLFPRFSVFSDCVQEETDNCST